MLRKTENFEMNTNVSSTEGNETETNIYLNTPSSVATVVDGEDFEQVSLNDCAKDADKPQGSVRDLVQTGNSEISSHYLHGVEDISRLPERSYLSNDSYFAAMQPYEFNIDSTSHEQTVMPIDHLLSSTSPQSPLESPQAALPELVMPKNVSPELLHLVDSAIMGKPGSLDKLKNIVSGVESFGEKDNTESIALSVVDSLLSTMGGVESFDEDEDNNPPSVMLNSRAAIVAAELIPSLPWLADCEGLVSPRTRIVRGLLTILRACTRNRSMCSAAGLLHALLVSAEQIFVQEVDKVESNKWDGTPLCYCIQYLAGHSLSVMDLHRWLQVISRVVTTTWASRLMLSLERAINSKESHGPACTFQFDGESSGLLGPGEGRWPFTNGFAFATWIYIESFADTLNAAAAAATIAAAAAAKSGKSSAMSAAAAASALVGEGTSHMPRLISFLSSDNQGVEAYFHAQFLVVEVCSGKGRRASLHFTYPFKSQSWYFIGLEHVYKPGLLGKNNSELRLYIDGLLYESRPFEFPRISKPLAFCCIGTNPPPTMAGLQRRRRQCPLFAEMGPIYIFKESIGPEKMSHLAFRGGDNVPSFGNGAGVPWLAINEHMQRMAEKSSLLDADISGCIHLLYHPKLLAGRFCPDISPLGASGALRRPAEALGQVHVAMRVRPAEALWALAFGGPLSLLPLTVSSVHKDSLEPLKGGNSFSMAMLSLAAPIFRIISSSITHSVNSEELSCAKGPEILSTVLKHLVKTMSWLEFSKYDGFVDEELVVAVVSLCQSPRNHHSLRVQLFALLLLDLKIWSLCNYGLQKKLLSSLADMVIVEPVVLRDAGAIQMLLDGCRRCYWLIREEESFEKFTRHGETRPAGEVNALVDELLVVIELLIGAASPPLAVDDMRSLLQFMVDCPQPNQVARVLHLIYRLIVQPNISRAHAFAKAFISCGGVETLLVLLQRESKVGDCTASEQVAEEATTSMLPEFGADSDSEIQKKNEDFQHLEEVGIVFQKEKSNHDFHNASKLAPAFTRTNIKRMVSITESSLVKNLGGISFSISADNARNNVYNVDSSDGIVNGIICLLFSLLSYGYLELAFQSLSDAGDNFLGNGMHESSGAMFDDKVSLLFFSLEKTLQSAPNRLFTGNVYASLLRASVNSSAPEVGLNFYDPGHRFEHVQILLVLLRVLPYASRNLQIRALQDLLFLACSHPENRISLTKMEEWPEWVLEVLISNYERDLSQHHRTPSLCDIDDLIHSFLIIMLEHSMRQKDGWKDIEATIHCAEWVCMVGGSSTGDQRIRREEALPIFKRRLLGGLMDFSARELRVQTQVIAAAAAGVVAEGLSPKEAKEEAENAAQLSVALVENSIVMLMLVEDHLRLQSKLFNAARAKDDYTFLPPAFSSWRQTDTMGAHAEESFKAATRGFSSSFSDGVPLNVLASLADASGQISAAVMERLTAAAAAEPYESVSCAFVSYGSCCIDLAEGWKFRSLMWYGLGHPERTEFGGGGSGWESWKSALEKDADGNWIDFPLVRKSVSMLEALLLDECGLGGGLGIGRGLGTGMGGMASLYQLLDSDQPFLCMLRMVLISLREEDNGDNDILFGNKTIDNEVPEASSGKFGSTANLRGQIRSLVKSSYSTLLWSVLSPILNMTISESKRQRVLVASCILYSEVWHAVSGKKVPLRKQYLEAILPPFVSILRKWRPLLAGIHELATADGHNPLVDDRALAADALPAEAALAMISVEWAAAFASPPAAMALAMVAAGAAGSDISSSANALQLKASRDSALRGQKTISLRAFSSFQQPSTMPNKSHLPKDKASAKAAALAAARDLERTAKVGSGRGLSAVAMATSAARRTTSDMNRAKRWNVTEAMGLAWRECLQSTDTKSIYGMDFNALSYKFVAILVASFALARNMQRFEVDRRFHAYKMDQYRVLAGNCAWRKLVHRLYEMGSLFGPVSDFLLASDHISCRLDFMESSLRMRQCLRRRYKGFNQFDAAANYGNNIHWSEVKFGDLLGAPPVAAEAVSDCEGGEKEVVSNSDPKSFELENSEDILLKMSRPHEAVLTEESSDGQFIIGSSLIQNSYDDASCYVPGEADERIVLEVGSSMVRLLQVTRGTFQVTTRRINFMVDREERNTGEKLEPDAKVGCEKDRCWLLTFLHQIHSRRYLLRRSALELFMVDRSNYFFDFGSTEGRRSVYRALVQARPPMLNDVYLATQRPEQLLKRTQLMERWAKREISNFEYLMQLNTLAGRSYNDITQYPVFPWILSDYKSKTLNLEDASCFRDLSKPVGALNPTRLQKFQERYSNFDDPATPKFHYGSHYSTAGTVLYYLVRAEPFTTLSVQLQGGKLDHADRIFSDISATWDGVLVDMSDVKELVPELFYFPEVLTNENMMDFGSTQLGEKIDSVRLPPWALSPIDFVRKHRMALESEHVSNHLHEWIDLIFGYKQRGKEAVLANNVFFYITYEGTVNIDKISDPVLQRSTQDQIAYFGQTPSQLLTVPHAKRLALADVLHLQTIFCNPEEVKSYTLPVSGQSNVLAAAIHASSDSIIVVDINAPAAQVAQHKWQPNTPDGHGLPFLFQHAKLGSSSSSGAFIRMFKGQAEPDGPQFRHAVAFAAPGVSSSATVSITWDQEIITGGHADNSVKIISSDGAKTLETATAHYAPVTCVSVSPDSSYLVTGSRDTTLILWRLHRKASHPNSMTNLSTTVTSPTYQSGDTMSNNLVIGGSKQRIEGPIHILRGHRKEITCCCINSDVGVVVSCSISSDVLLHSTNKGRLLRRLPGVEAHGVCLSSDGTVLAWNNVLHLISTFTLNGVPICSMQFPASACIRCIETSFDAENALVAFNSSSRSGEDSDIGTSDVNVIRVPVPSICLLSLHNLKVRHMLTIGETDITAMALNKDHTNLVVSTANNQLIILTDPALSLKVVDQMLKLGWEGESIS